MAHGPVVFKAPPEGYQTLLLLALFAWVDSANPGTLGARIRKAVGGESVLSVIRSAALLIHIVEGVAMAYVTIKRGASTTNVVCTR